MPYPSCTTRYRADLYSLPSLWFLVLELNQTKLHNFSILATKGNPIACLLICNTRYKKETRYLNPNLSFILILLCSYEKIPHHIWKNSPPRKRSYCYFQKCVKRKWTQGVTFALQVPSWAGICSCPSAQVFLLYVTHKIARLRTVYFFFFMV